MISRTWNGLGSGRRCEISEITQRVKDYRAGLLSLDQLVADLANWDYKVPAYIVEREGMSSDERYLAAEWADRFEDGTWGEVHALYDDRKLTQDEYYAILTTIYANHRPE